MPEPLPRGAGETTLPCGLFQAFANVRRFLTEDSLKTLGSISDELRKSVFFIRGSEPRLADIVLVKDHYEVFRQVRRAIHAAFMSFGFGECDESRDMTI